RDSRGRGPLPASGARARPEAAGGAAAPDPGDPPRSRDPRADLRARVHLGRQSTGRGARDQPAPELRLLGALRGSQAQASVTIAARDPTERETAQRRHSLRIFPVCEFVGTRNVGSDSPTEPVFPLRFEMFRFYDFSNFSISKISIS